MSTVNLNSIPVSATGYLGKVGMRDVTLSSKMAVYVESNFISKDLLVQYWHGTLKCTCI